jgi:hypothetical protein
MGAYQAARAELDAAEAACLTGADCELERLEAATSAFEAAGGYAIDAKVARVLTGLGFETDEFDQRCDTFSGGWQMRIGYAPRAATPLAWPAAPPPQPPCPSSLVKERLVMERPAVVRCSKFGTEGNWGCVSARPYLEILVSLASRFPLMSGARSAAMSPAPRPT